MTNFKWRKLKLIILMISMTLYDDGDDQCNQYLLVKYKASQRKLKPLVRR